MGPDAAAPRGWWVSTEPCVTTALSIAEKEGRWAVIVVIVVTVMWKVCRGEGEKLDDVSARSGNFGGWTSP